MFLAKKYFLSFLFIISFGVLQFNFCPLIQPVNADSTLFNNQSLLQNSTKDNYGNNPKNIKIIAVRVLKTLLTFIGIIMVALIMYTGFQYFTAAGNEAKMSEALGNFKSLIIGLLIILASWGITTYVLKWMLCATSATSGNCGALW